MVTVFGPLPSNAFLLIEYSVEGNTIVCSDGQLENAPPPIASSPSGSVTDTRLAHPLNKLTAEVESVGMLFLL